MEYIRSVALQDRIFATFCDPLTAAGPAVREIFDHPTQYAGQTLPVIGEVLSAQDMVDTFVRVTGQPARYASAYSREDLLRHFPDFAALRERTKKSIAEREKERPRPLEKLSVFVETDVNPPPHHAGSPRSLAARGRHRRVSCVATGQPWRPFPESPTFRAGRKSLGNSCRAFAVESEFSGKYRRETRALGPCRC